MAMVTGVIKSIQNHFTIFFFVASVIVKNILKFFRAFYLKGNIYKVSAQDDKINNKIWKIARFVCYFARLFQKEAYKQKS